MSNIVHSIISPFADLPEAIQHPYLAGVAVAGVAAAYGAVRARHAATDEKAAAEFQGNGALAEATLRGYQKSAAKERVRPVSIAAVGAGLLAVQFLGQPETTQTVPDTEASVVVVEDVSNSMVYTSDIEGKTRLDAMNQALSLAKFTRGVGLVQTAANSKIVSAPQVNWKGVLASNKTPQVNSNGGELAAAVTQAASLFEQDPDTGKRHGTVIIVSDGTINDSKETVTKTFAAVEANGVEIEVVVPGTKAGTYVLPNTTNKVSSAVQAERFEESAAEVHTALSISELGQALGKSFQAASEQDKQVPWKVPGIVGGFALAAAFVMNTARTADRRI